MDSFVLTGPQGTALNIGSYVHPEGIDFGSKDLLKALYAENTISDGGVLKVEDLGVRTFTFPMLLPTSSAFTGGLTGLEALIRNVARPGAYIDLLVDGVATADAIRFDVLAGRLEDSYSGYHHRQGRRETTLKLDVQPIGYLPTLITLASAASIGLPGNIAIPAGSVMGDWPGQAELLVTPTHGPTTYGPGSWYPDMLAWSFAGRASHVSYWRAASIIQAFGGSIASVIGDFAAPASQAVAINNSAALSGPGNWGLFSWVQFVSGSGPFLEGRHRVFAWAKLTPSQLPGYQITADLVFDTGMAMASAQPVASLAPAVASGAPGAFGAQPSSAFTLLDLGEIQANAMASSYPGANQYLRVWLMTPSHMVASQTVSIGGLHLMPQDGPAGVLTRGVALPSIGNPANVAAPVWDPRTPVKAPVGLVGSIPLADLAAYYRGGLPYVGASTVTLELLGGHRKVASGATAPVAYGNRAFAAVSVRYRPRFQFLKGI